MPDGPAVLPLALWPPSEAKLGFTPSLTGVEYGVAPAKALVVIGDDGHDGRSAERLG